MCGITGFTGHGTKSNGLAMMRSLFHRGPDADGFWMQHDPILFMGHQRLSILDHDGGAQPMWSDDHRLCVVFNGEIYNHLQLRKSLINKGFTFRSDHSDTEVLLYAYRQWGMDMPEQLNGMWAFAILDLDRTCLFLSRDRFGQKPLYYSFQNQVFAFSSELKSIIQHPDIHANISKKALMKYYAYGYIPAPYSLYETIYKLPAGHNLWIDYRSLNHKKWAYWDYEIKSHAKKNKVSQKQLKDWSEQLVDSLKQAVHLRMPADVPVGFFLSGGMDSASVVAMGRTNAQTIQTFSIGFQERSFDESPYSKFLSKYFKTRHYHDILSLEKARNILPSLINKLDEPMGDASFVPTALLCQQTRKKVTVALGGDGADELFLGYDPFHAARMFQLYQKFVPRPIHDSILALASLVPVSFGHMSPGFILRKSLAGVSYPQKLWNPLWMGPLSPKQLAELFNEPIDLEDIYEEAIYYWEKNAHLSLMDKAQIFFIKLYLQDSILTKIDRASMIHSLEVRSPFLDIRFVDLVRQIPWYFKYRFFKTKYILKQAFKQYLPDKIIKRKKHGFGVPVGQWFYERKLQWPSLEMTHLNRQVADLYKNEHLQQINDHRLFLWNHWVLSNYL